MRFVRFVSVCGFFCLLTSASISGADAKDARPTLEELADVQLTKFEYKGAARTRFQLEIVPKRKGLKYKTFCDLRSEDGKPIGRFPIAQVESAAKPDLFRFNCLADKCIPKSSLYLYVLDEQTGKSLRQMRIQLRDAKTMKPKSKKE